MCSAPGVGFSKKGWPHWLPSPVAGRKSTVRARFGYPRTPRDGSTCVLMAPERGPVTIYLSMVGDLPPWHDISRAPKLVAFTVRVL